MIQFSVNEDKCTKCGLCASDCILGVISISEEGIPFVDSRKEKHCMQCQHCMTICKPGAISILGLNPEDSTPLKGNMPDAKALTTLMKGRRSTRQFKQEALPSEDVDHLLDIAAHAPTGKNRLGVLYSVVDDPAVMDAIRTRTYDAVRKAVEAGTVPEGMEFFSYALKGWEKGEDMLFRGAPNMVIASVPNDAPAGEADPFIGLSYFELMANAMGIGTVWCGFAKWAFEAFAPELRAQFNIPDDHKLSYVMMFGKPAVKYHRTVQRSAALNVNRISL